ncbi:HK97 gp10 family phage protein [Lachnospira eligens]|uniref:HK97 gp10 family phage protein n=1 Tax=Lachnospira eligens TaxID=39485 RepID=UPI000E5D9FC1|nr:HK97 gp10 family phage protein [Lachnospira eligens]RGZ70253.1 HK97 gp10 family phage protein [Lachnospira eligens]
MADVEFIDNTMMVNRAIEDAVGVFLLEASGEIASEAARNTSVDTGQLKGSWKANVDKSKGEATIGSGLENAIWNELGTGEWAANKDGRKNPWYIPVDGYNGKKKLHLTVRLLLYMENMERLSIRLMVKDHSTHCRKLLMTVNLLSLEEQKIYLKPSLVNEV